jgi:hypothetical protein
MGIQGIYSSHGRRQGGHVRHIPLPGFFWGGIKVEQKKEENYQIRMIRLKEL